MEYPIRQASDGSHRWHLVQAELIRDRAGCIERWVGTAQDVHDFRVAHERLAQREARLDALGMATPGFVCLKDRAGRLVWRNRAVLKGLGRQAYAVFGRTDREFLGPGPHTDAIEAHDRLVMEQGRTLVIEKRLRALFGQAEPGMGPQKGGLGIGLALVKRLVQLHSGRVHAGSGGQGHGACFVVRLPRPDSDQPN